MQQNWISERFQLKSSRQSFTTASLIADWVNCCANLNADEYEVSICSKSSVLIGFEIQFTSRTSSTKISGLLFTINGNFWQRSVLRQRFGTKATSNGINFFKSLTKKICLHGNNKSMYSLQEQDIIFVKYVLFVEVKWIAIAIAIRREFLYE